ncbi:glycoside hydrolase family 3 N-terminal domain-containing protein [Roseimarinus sediminis]|uniref:glycoside hydrolase family 3 N-terminal domain-containing protein n=1 Tax=Roseimarinus sediminis TaxID=1610899 RepID=UPI003D255158
MYKTLLQVSIISLLLVVGMNKSRAQEEQVDPYKNLNLTAAERASDLLSRMSLEDKIYQMMGVLDGTPDRFNAEFVNNPAEMERVFGKGVHSVQPFFDGLEVTVASRNKIQHYLREETKWGIPAIFVDEGQHGLMKPEATVFPMAIGLACSWNPALLEEVYAATAREMRSRGAQWALSPVIDVCRDPRWGRVDETYGEDPYLNGVYAIAAVKGFQGTSNGTVAPDHVAATLKHFCGHGQPEGGLNQAPANYSERSLREFQFLPFQMVIEQAKPLAVMPSYNEIDGVPSHANSWLLTDVLRKEWGFEGLVISDWNAIDQLDTKHFVANNKKEAAMLAFNAGVQFELPNRDYYKNLEALVNEGKVQLETLDQAVYDLLKLKFELGLFDQPFTDVETAIAVSKDPASKALALRAAHESIVLLKNENNLLPLEKGKYKKIAVVGPCANELFMGGYSGEPYEKVTLLQGIQNKVGNSSEVLFAQGCRITENHTISQFNWRNEAIVFTQREVNLKLIEEAVAVAQQADIIILAVGETEFICREAWSKTHLGDNMTLDLVGEQQELVEAMVATGKPVVVYLTNGRPLSVNYIQEKVPAVIEGWYMGQETGTAAADILFGDVNPSGKLTITIPKSVGQLPLFYNHKPSARYIDYVSQDVQPLYPFGHGLSYTTFEYDQLKLSSDKIKKGETLEVSLVVTNTGKMKGDEVVQLYLRDKVSSVTRPVKELKDFKRISLEAGESQTVRFTLDASKLAFWDINMNYVVEPGEFEVMVGRSSVDVLSVSLLVE